MRYSIGDIFKRPTYKYWEQEDTAGSTYMICLILLIFVGLLFMMIIVLLNFLIAVISQTYEDVMSRKIVTTILQMAEMNRECRLILDALNQDRTLPPFILSTEKIDADMKETWQGFIVTIKNHINDNSNFTNERLALVYGHLNRKIDHSVSSLNSKVGDLDTRVSNFRKDIKDCLDKLR